MSEVRKNQMKAVIFGLVILFGAPVVATHVLGQTWTRTGAPGLAWQAVASSADGSRLVAAVSSGGIYTSTNYGVTWVNNNLPSESWVSVASSADGSMLVAVPFNTVRQTAGVHGIPTPAHLETTGIMSLRPPMA